MRKGLTLSLAATASLLTASAAFAYGPTILGVPDVYIAKNSTVLSGAGVETFTNVYKFDNAFKIMDYVTPGVSSGNGSTSDSLYWGYGIRATVGSGSYLAPSAAASSILYKIGSTTATPVTPIQIASTPLTAAWKTEINQTNGAALKKASLNGRLSFYNVALSPLPSANAVSDPFVTTPTWGAQREATLYVTDLSTTPGADELLIVTTGISTDVDTLSGGGALCTPEVIYSSTTTFGSAFLLGTDWNGPGQGTTSGLGSFESGTNNGTALTLTTQLSTTGIPSGAGLYVQFSTGALAVNTSKVYRLKASVTSTNTVGSLADPTLITELSDPTTVGYYSSAGQQFSTLTGSTPKCTAAYLWPVANGSATPLIIMFDSFATTGGTFTAQNIRIDSFNPANLIGALPLYDAGTGAASQFAAVASGTNGSWTIPTTAAFTILNFASGSAVANFTVAPSAAGNSNTLAINTASSASASIQGIASWEGQALYTPTANRFIVVKGTVKTANTTLKYPKTWLVATGSSPSYGSAGTVVASNIDTGGVGPITTTGTDIRVAYDSFGSAATNVTFRAFASVTATNTLSSDITLTRLTATSYQSPVCPCP